MQLAVQFGVPWLAESSTNSFVAGTGGVTGEDADGNSITNNIEDLEVGDVVLTRDEFSPNAPVPYSLVNVVSHRTVYQQIIVTYTDALSNVETIQSTDNHEYFVGGVG